jgi:hypothetical protein
MEAEWMKPKMIDSHQWPFSKVDRRSQMRCVRWGETPFEGCDWNIPAAS